MAVRKKKEQVEPVHIVAALTVEDDYWLLVQNEMPSKVMGKWIVNFMGPAPKAGQWMSMSGTAHSKENLWRWDMPKGKLNPGDWFFYGRKPEYLEGRWVFVSERPELFFALSGKISGKRITTDQYGALVVADNSEGSKKSLAVHIAKGVNAGIVSGKHAPIVEKAPLPVAAPKNDFSKFNFGTVTLLAEKVKTASAQTGNPLFIP